MLAPALSTDPLATDRLNDLPQVPGRLVYLGGRIECSRQGEWIPGTIIATPDQIDRDQPLEIAVNLDWPDRGGATHISTDSFKIRAATVSTYGPEACAEADRMAGNGPFSIIAITGANAQAAE